MMDAGRVRTWLLISTMFGLAFSPSCSCGSDLAQSPRDAGSPVTDGALDVAASDAADAAPGDASLSECERSAGDHSVAGCEYLVFSPHGLYAFACTAVVLSNLSSSDATIELEFQGGKLDATKYLRLISGSGRNITYDVVSQPTIPPGRSAVVSAFQGKVEDLGRGQECPSMAVGSVMAPADSLGDGLWIRSTMPVSAFFDHPYGCPSSNAEGATALRSTATWDTRYRDVGIYKPGRPDKQFGAIGRTEPGWTAFTGGTTTTVTLASDAGPKQVVLTRGRVFTAMQDDGFIGSLISGTQPFGAWVHSRTAIPWDWPNLDFTYLQFASTADWGWEYAAVRYPSRYPPTDKTSMWRIVGDAAGTVLTYDPAPPPGAPTALAAGQFVIFRTGDPFVVRSQDRDHRFYLMQVMTGWTDSLGVQDAEAPEDGGWLDGGYPPGAYGDPEAQGTPPLHEYATRYVFFTQPTYPTTQLVFIRHRGPSGFRDVTLDCAGTLTGWNPIGGSDYEWVYVALSDGNYVPQVYAGGTCDNGNHVAESDGPFSIAVWAWPTIVEKGEIFPYATSYGYLVSGRTVSPRAMGDGGLLPN